MQETTSLSQDLQQKIFAITGGTDIPVCTANAYDAVKILASAVAKVGTDPDQLAATIRATSYNGVSGQIAFDQNGDDTMAAYVVDQIQNGTAVQISK